MKTIKYKTLRGVMDNLGIRRITLNNFLQCQVWSSKHGDYIKFELDEITKIRACKLFSNALCSTKQAKDKYANLIYCYCGKSYGIFDRLWIEKKDNNIFTSIYCAGQDWTSETRYVQNLLRKKL